MGKGDKKTGRGKRFMGTYGKTRKRRSKRKTQLELANLAKRNSANKEEAVVVEKEKPKAKKAATKKKTTKKTAK